MKKNKLVALSLLAFAGVGALASCAGGKQPTQKVDVYFHAKSRIIVDSATGKTEPTEYIDSECATIEVKDKDKLKYGEQDVEITIKPTKFFTCRAYDSDWYPVGAPVKPYVGLGNPHSLYNYPLEENVAWTFEDKTTAENGEAYLITVKKEFFQKNIVIDYGNAIASNAIYAYTSNFYNKLFTDNLEFVGDFNNKNTYEMDNSLSTFVAASKGAIITYKFKNEVNPYTFDGWDYHEPQSTNDGLEYYTHFHIKGIKEDDSEVELATFDPKLSDSEQKFQVSITDSKYITFFIKWDLLAKNDKDYTPLYKKIKMSFSEPTLKYVFDHTQVADGIVVYDCDFYQHPSQTSRKPFTDDGVVETWNLEDPQQPPLTFKNVFVNGKNLPTGEHVQFASIFKLSVNPEQNKWFTVAINDRSLKVDLDNPIKDLTKWHAGTGIEGETELQYWQIKNTTGEVLWNLVQLNPEGRTCDAVPEKFRNQGNLYYLYSTNAKIFTEAEAYGNKFSLEIHYDDAPEYATFNLNNDSKTYGKLNPTGADPYSVTYDCVGKNEVDIRFYPENEYKALTFDVVLPELAVGEYATTYTPGDDYATINIKLYSATFTENDPVIIALQQIPTKVRLVGETNVLGGFVVEGQDNPMPECIPGFDGDTAFCTFKFINQYGSLAFNLNQVTQVLSYNGGKQLEESEIRQTGGDTIEIRMTPKKGEAIQEFGFTFSIEFIYMNVMSENRGDLEAKLQELGVELFLDEEQDFNKCVGQPTSSEFVVNYIVKNEKAFEEISKNIAAKVVCAQTPIDDSTIHFMPSKSSPTVYELHIGFNKGLSDHIQNGSEMNIILGLTE